MRWGGTSPADVNRKVVPAASAVGVAAAASYQLSSEATTSRAQVHEQPPRRCISTFWLARATNGASGGTPHRVEVEGWQPIRRL